jgi:hypothetical protein
MPAGEIVTSFADAARADVAVNGPFPSTAAAVSR